MSIPEILIISTLFIPYIAALIWVISSLVLYFKTPKDSPKKRARRALLIASLAVGGTAVISIAGLALIAVLPISFM